MPRLMDKAKEDKAQGILVVPDWPQSMMARETRCCKELEVVGRWRPVFECPAWFRTSTFRGRSDFDVLVFLIRF